MFLAALYPNFCEIVCSFALLHFDSWFTPSFLSLCSTISLGLRGPEPPQVQPEALVILKLCKANSELSEVDAAAFAAATGAAFAAAFATGEAALVNALAELLDLAFGLCFGLC